MIDQNNIFFELTSQSSHLMSSDAPIHLIDQPIRTYMYIGQISQVFRDKLIRLSDWSNQSNYLLVLINQIDQIDWLIDWLGQSIIADQLY